MSRERENRTIAVELTRLVEQGVVTPAQRARIAEQYPTGTWDVVALARWFTILGAVAMGAGAVIIATHVIDAWFLADLGLGLVAAGALAGGVYLERKRGYGRTGAALQLLGSFAIQGLVTSLAIRFSSGSGNWPLLMAVCAAVTAVLAYALANRLILIQALVDAFFAFGGSTGYISGWGAYWLGMDYPLRFIAAGLVTLGAAWLHAVYVGPPRQGFARVYAHHGLLVLNLALWFLSLFGYFDGHDYFRWEGKLGERLLFSSTWAGVSVAALLLGGRYNLRWARGHGLTFLLINAYTAYFQFIAVHTSSAWFLHLLLVGGSLVAIGFILEGRLREERNRSRGQASVQ